MKIKDLFKNTYCTEEHISKHYEEYCRQFRDTYLIQNDSCSSMYLTSPSDVSTYLVSPVNTDIVCNGFNLKDTILEELLKSSEVQLDTWDNIAERIVNALAVKMHIVQGTE